MKSIILRALCVIMMWAIAFNCLYEPALLFLSFNPFSRIGASIFAFETINRRNYTNTISVLPSELSGQWKVQAISMGNLFSNEFHSKTSLRLNEDQTFELTIPVSDYKSIPLFYNGQLGIPDSITQKETNEQFFHLRGNWGLFVRDRSSYINKSKIYFTMLCVRYEGEQEYVPMGEILDRHLPPPRNSYSIKWTFESNELGPDSGVYLTKDERGKRI